MILYLKPGGFRHPDHPGQEVSAGEFRYLPCPERPVRKFPAGIFSQVVVREDKSGITKYNAAYTIFKTFNIRCAEIL